MSLEELIIENGSLKATIKQLEEKIKLSEAKMKKYTNSEAHKKYYSEHREEVKTNGTKYLKELKIKDPEKLKAYWRKAYEKRKLKKNEIKIE